MTRLHIAGLTLAIGLSACQPLGPSGPVVIPPIPMPPQVQQYCTMIEIGVPIAEQLRSRMTPPQQALLTSAEGALAACSAGNATEAIIVVALGLEQYLAGTAPATAARMRAVRR